MIKEHRPEKQFHIDRLNFIFGSFIIFIGLREIIDRKDIYLSLSVMIDLTDR